MNLKIDDLISELQKMKDMKEREELRKNLKIHLANNANGQTFNFQFPSRWSANYENK